MKLMKSVLIVGLLGSEDTLGNNLDRLWGLFGSEMLGIVEGGRWSWFGIFYASLAKIFSSFFSNFFSVLFLNFISKFLFQFFFFDSLSDFWTSLFFLKEQLKKKIPRTWMMKMINLELLHQIWHWKKNQLGYCVDIWEWNIRDLWMILGFDISSHLISRWITCPLLHESLKKNLCVANHVLSNKISVKTILFH